MSCAGTMVQFTFSPINRRFVLSRGMGYVNPFPSLEEEHDSLHLSYGKCEKFN